MDGWEKLFLEPVQDVCKKGIPEASVALAQILAFYKDQLRKLSVNSR